MFLDQWQSLLPSIPAFVLVFFRVAGLMLAAPLFGSAQVPRPLKLLMSLILAVAMVPALPHHGADVRLPKSLWAMTAGIGGELVFGLIMGLSLSLAFIAVNWAGDIIGQQIGFNLGEAMDPSMGAQSSVIGDMYFMFLMVMFLMMDGHHAILRGLRDSFVSLPLLSVGPSRDLFRMLIGLLQASTGVAIQLAAPVLLTMLVVDLALGFIGKTMPQINVMTAGNSMKSMIGIAVLLASLAIASQTMRGAILDSMHAAMSAWRGAV